MEGCSERVRAWAMDGRRAGRLPDPDGIGEVGLGPGERGRNLAVRMTLTLAEGRVADTRYQVFGCGYLMAACAVAADRAAGRALDDARDLDAATLERALGGLPEERRHCADLAARALRLALDSAGERRGVRSERLAIVEPGARVGPEDPVYRALMASRAPSGVAAEDRHLYACLLAVAAREPEGAAAALGLAPAEVMALRAEVFPDAAPDRAPRFGCGAGPVADPEIRDILFAHVPPGRAESRRFARILAARAARPGHLWVAMGLFRRPELTAAIGRHLPTLAEANAKRMRWKKFLFKTLCERSGAALCKAPNCGVCGDRAACFAPGDE